MRPVRVVQFSILGIFGFLFGFKAFTSDAVIHTQNGDVRGVSQGQVQSFKGLPYAAPPIGSLRWMPPQDPDNWTGIRDASNFSPECPQTSKGGVFVGNEDCLYLNVFGPVGANALPVMVFLHGGSNVRGSAGEILHRVAVYDGSQLAQNGNVVVVTLNYRLGTLGFVGHPKLSATSGYGASGNYAYMDQIQALKWVQRNIAAFGGDPTNVTLFGHSAGAKSVWVHLTSPLSAGLFRRAIVHSGTKEGAGDFHFAEQRGVILSQNLQCSDAPDELACMRGKSAMDVVNAMSSDPGKGLYRAVVDNKVLTGSPLEIMQHGGHHHMAILEGNVKDEMSTLGLPQGTIHSEQDYEQAVENAVASIPGASAAEVLRLYPTADYPSPTHAFNAISADKDYVCTSRKVLTALSATQSEFVGRFFYTHAYSDGPEAPFGAAHGFELLFIFGTLGAAQFSPTVDELALAKTFQDTWSNFARTGAVPGSWKRYDASRDNYVIFDTAQSESDHLRKQQCDYWDSLGG